MMKPRVWAILLITGNMVFTSAANAQQWGTGMWGGQQGCGPGYGAANGAVSEDDEVNELQDLRRDLRKEKRDSERRLRDLDQKKDKYTTAINDGVRSGLAEQVLSHMENGYNCNCAPPQAPPIIDRPYEEVYQPPVEQAPPIQQPEPEPPPPPPAPRPKPRDPRPASDIFEPSQQTRMPASDLGAPPPRSETRGGGYVPAGTGVGPENPIDREFMASMNGQGSFGGPQGGGFNSMCGPANQWTGTQAWGYVCRDGGGVSKEVCTHPVFKSPESKGSSLNDCKKAIDDYRKVVREADKLRNKISALDDQITNIGIQIGDLKRDRKFDKDLEASCPTGECYKRRERSETKSSNLWGTVLPLAAGVLGGLGAEYLGYTANKQNNTNLNKLGWPTQPYQAGSYGFPFFQAGIYGAVAGSTNGGFGCNGVNPYGMGGPFGGINPYTQQGYGGAFGYPQGMIPGFPSMGGGMYAPGMGPWGQAGPWGNGYNPYGGGLAGGFAGGIAGGMMMPGMAGGFQGGFAGMPGMAGGFAGMPGMAGGVGFMSPMGGGYAGMPGMAGGLAIGGMMPGMAGGYAGMPGMMQPGMVGGVGLMNPGLAGGLTSGFTTPWGVAGGFSGGGFLAPTPGMGGGMMMPGMAGGYGNQAIQGQLQQYQMQLDMQRRASDNYSSQMRTQQGLMSEYYSLMYRMQQVNSGGLGGGGLVGGIGGGIGGGLVGGYGLGVGVGLTGGYSLPTTTPYSVIPGSTVGVPGRTR